MTEVEKTLATLRQAADEAQRNASRSAALVEDRKLKLAELTQRLPEFGIETWAQATEKLHELGAQAQKATEEARVALVAEGIISD